VLHLRRVSGRELGPLGPPPRATRQQHDDKHSRHYGSCNMPFRQTATRNWFFNYNGSAQKYCSTGSCYELAAP
jgi:hypothetical protein